MSQSETSKYKILQTTSRRFYSKKKPTHDIFLPQPRLSKVMKALNNSCTMALRRIQPAKTQRSFLKYSQQETFNESEFIKKQLKASLEMLIKKCDKKWKLLYQSYQDLKTCTNKQAVVSQQNNFYSIFYQLLKVNVQQDKHNQNIQKRKQNIQRRSQNIQKRSQNIQKRQQKPFKMKKNAKINLVQLQNIKLEKQNDILRKKCLQKIQFQGQPFSMKKVTRHKITMKTLAHQQITQEDQDKFYNFQQITKDFNQKIKVLQNQNLKFKESIAILEQDTKFQKNQINILSKKLHQTMLQNQEIYTQNSKLRDQNMILKQKLTFLRSTMRFQREQILSYECQTSLLKKQLYQLNRKYKLILKRTLKSTQTVKAPQSVLKHYQTFKQQSQTFLKVRSIFINKDNCNNLDKTLADKKKGDNYKNFINEKQGIGNVNGIKRTDREHYAYFKPSFYHYVEAYMYDNGIDGNNVCQLNIDVGSDFIATIRSILDAKFNEFLTQKWLQISSVSSSTYSWLSTFTINKRSKKTCLIQSDLSVDAIPIFYLTLMSQKLNFNWQIITFRQLLMDTLTKDQVYFYLMARNYIFQGDLMTNLNAAYHQIYYVNVADALGLMQKFVLDTNYRRKLDDYVKKFIVYIRKRPLIDVHFLLRILLEYYQAKKHQQFKQLNSLTSMLTKQNKQSLCFADFLKILQYNYTFLSLTQKLQLYKKCYSCSRGKITLEIILTVLTQQGYLCYQIKKIFLNDEIKFVRKDQTNDQNSFQIVPNLAELNNFQNLFRHFANHSFQILKTNTASQKIIKQYVNLKQFTQNNIFDRLKFVFDYCISYLQKMFYTKKITIQKFTPILQGLTQFLMKFNKSTCQKKQILDIMNKLKMQSAGKKILRFYRKKKNQMHRNFAFNAKDIIEEEDEKVVNIRNQFNYLIQNLKDKFSN